MLGIWPMTQYSTCTCFHMHLDHWSCSVQITWSRTKREWTMIIWIPSITSLGVGVKYSGFSMMHVFFQEMSYTYYGSNGCFKMSISIKAMLNSSGKVMYQFVIFLVRTSEMYCHENCNFSFPKILTLFCVLWLILDALSQLNHCDQKIVA